MMRPVAMSIGLLQTKVEKLIIGFTGSMVIRVIHEGYVTEFAWLG
jgi:hypothetical protein